ncbi:serine hydrolase [Colwellia sp. RSH04]|uniref:serine hydrolase domain-containing protein n=1 Tax=Colwellia sp. RSH04 TaxID=2305464 RepID=UPI000E58BE72|nr:serine hydrolase domain-containing protein [Colwellia sp. RSH04]RHW76331.1 class A beta-lactamase-related serine hydrolase [Colwellia sp. RSH04]
MYLKYLISLSFSFFTLANCTNALANTYKANLSKSKSYQYLVKELSDELNQLHNKNNFDGTIILLSRDQEIFSHSYGFANRASKIKNTEDTVSDIGSIAKTFTAGAILKLVSEGKLTLETKLADIFPDSPSDKKALTIKSLLSHSSGIDNFHNQTDFDVMSKAEAIDKIFDLSMIGKQGKTVKYSNAAYTLLAAIVEKIANMNFQTYVHKNLIKPLKLNNTGFYSDKKINYSNIAKGYGGSDNGQTTFEKGLTWALVGQGGMVSSANDLAIWFTAILNGNLPLNKPENLMLQQANKKWMLGNIRHFSSWGTLSYYAGGSTDFGYTALAQYLPDLDISIIILLNSYLDKYENRSHQKLSKEHIFPILLNKKS